MGKILKKRLKQTNFENAAQEAVLNLLIAANYMRARIDTLCAENGITHSQFNVLRILKGAKQEGYPRGEIINRMVEPAPDVTRLIDRLIKQNLVERFPGSVDRRLSLTRITKDGEKLLKKINPKVIALINDYTKSLNNKEKKQLSALCEKLYAKEVK